MCQDTIHPNISNNYSNISNTLFKLVRGMPTWRYRNCRFPDNFIKLSANCNCSELHICSCSLPCHKISPIIMARNYSYNDGADDPFVLIHFLVIVVISFLLLPMLSATPYYFCLSFSITSRNLWARSPWIKNYEGQLAAYILGPAVEAHMQKNTLLVPPQTCKKI